MQTYIFMFVIAATVSLGWAGLTPEEQKMLEEFSQKCIGDTGVDAGIVAAAKNGQYSDDAKLGEYSFCFAKSVGFLNDAGDIMIDHIKEIFYAHLDKDTSDAMLSNCMNKKATPQETALEMGKCMHKYKE